jgi:hypothetical protein
VYDVKRDPQETKPVVVKAGSSEYQKETSLLARWFASTDLATGEAVLSKRDVELLRSLGYIQ